jgi:hypothetical protein
MFLYGRGYMDGRVGSITALVMFVIVIIYGALNELPIFVTVSFIAVVCLCIELLNSRRNIVNQKTSVLVTYKIVVNPKIALLAAIMTVAGTVVMSIFPYVPGTVDRVMWGHVSGILYWMAAYPISFLILETLAVTTRAKYNYPLLSGLPVFITCAQEVLAWIVVSIFYTVQIDSEQIATVEVIASMVTGIILSIIAGIIIGRIVKRKRFVLKDDTCGVKR